MIDNERYKIINGNNLDVLDTLEENSVDAIVTDPPYELGFMGKKWDNSGIAYNIVLWKKAFKVLKPGGHLLAFGGTRTYHRIACAIEDAGFEIRDCIMWLYGSGFPKSHNIGFAVDELNGVESKIVGKASHSAPNSKTIYTTGIYNETLERERERRIIPDIKKAQNEWDGWGTALKPAYEPIIMARKPIAEDTIAKNVVKYGVGAINIDECRVATNDYWGHGDNGHFDNVANGYQRKNKSMFADKPASEMNENGRFPANVITDGSEEVASGMPNTKSNGSDANYEFTKQDNPSHLYTNIKSGNHFEDEGSVMRYFYSAKASKKDRDDGLDMLENSKRNIHPTVKPVELMQYLVRLVTPKGKGATVLDIFNGSGSTGKAVAFENRERDADYKYIGIELDPEYCEISKARIDYAVNKYEYDMIQDIKKDEIEKGQLSLFDFNDND